MTNCNCPIKLAIPSHINGTIASKSSGGVMMVEYFFLIFCRVISCAPTNQPTIRAATAHTRMYYTTGDHSLFLPWKEERIKLTPKTITFCQGGSVIISEGSRRLGLTIYQPKIPYLTWRELLSLNKKAVWWHRRSQWLEWFEKP